MIDLKTKIESLGEAIFKPVRTWAQPPKTIEDRIKILRICVRGKLNSLEYQWNIRFAPPMMCPLRTGYPVHVQTDHDYWRTQGKDLCCSYCGSWKTDEFLAFVKHVVETDGQCGQIELNDHRDKIYANREHVLNADDGAVKFKLAHLSNVEFNANKDMINKALSISNRIFREKDGKREKEKVNG